ncbi:MAG: DUF892 family protein [Mucilaginibacter sp.]|uniref:DUF892 family protein n=1 Tax=Mucilaginibacter sp. TaxID=1882438 RepID=UPI0034E3C931
MEKPFLCGNLQLNENSLNKVFLFNLNQIYSILQSLTQSLPVLADKTCFGDLHFVVEELLSEVFEQIGHIETVFLQLKEVPAKIGSPTANDILKLAIGYHEDENQHKLSNDLALVFHLQQILVVKCHYFQLLKSIANSLNDITVKENIQYCFDQCAENQTLFKLIAKEYMESRVNVFL